MSDEQFFKEQPERNVFLQILERYLPFWPLFVITTALSLAIGFVYLRSQVPIYVASAKVLLKDPNKGTGDSKVLDALNIFGDKKIVENEIVVLRSTNIMHEVVKELNLYASVYNEGKVRVEELYKENSPVYFFTSQPEDIIPSDKFYFTVDWKRNLITINNKTVHFNDSVLLNNTNYLVVPNPVYNKSLTGKNYYVQFNTIDGAAGGIIGDLKATAISNQSTVIDVRLETPVPQKGIDIITKLFEVYNATGIADKNQTAAKTLAFIDNRLGLVTSQLDTVERKVENFKSTNQVIDLSAQAQVFLDRVKDYDKSKSEIDIKLDVLNDVNNYVNSKGKKSGTVPSLTLLEDPILSSLVTKLYDAEFQLEKIRSISGEKSDAVILADEQVNRLRSDIRENLGNIRKIYYRQEIILIL
jgi:tyrosine-protein kinase Etk/Wzc